MRTRTATAAVLLILATVLPGPSAQALGSAGTEPTQSGLSAVDTQTLRDYAVATWRSFVAMVDPDSGLPADSLGTDGSHSVQTSTTNVGAYLWSTLVAERLGIIG